MELEKLVSALKETVWRNHELEEENKKLKEELQEMADASAKVIMDLAEKTQQLFEENQKLKEGSKEPSLGELCDAFAGTQASKALEDSIRTKLSQEFEGQSQEEINDELMKMHLGACSMMGLDPLGEDARMCFQALKELVQ